ncbi:kinase domain protein (macronuclear) [Tetrahymena thermophila SB210]|uniref:Kinase domain protein n=1 Tax=Tetrahymena thermophila (strain SB210) TaxID=312017 RepID=W7XDM5_TETTS|nr:kinase domain protein [Tetrahymena thermophila SB210]EWS75682.1 kinase domain protein [Tetrahymena thermophila SB210]|eukprot:XP_012651828.1 kinase domain protein [Tetrahymena thermophila SB210]
MSQELTDQIDNQINIKPNELILDYAFKNIDDSKLKIIGEKIASCTNLQKLIVDLEENSFTENGIQYFAQEIQRCESLDNIKLILPYNHLNNQSAAYLSQSLVQLKNLRKLCLDLSVNGISDGISKIGELIVQNTAIKYLDLILSDNPIHDQQAQLLSKCISQSQSIKGITLMLPEVNVGNIGFQSLIEALTQSQSLEQFKLVLIDSGHAITQESLVKFGQAISKNNKLISFHLSLSNIPRDDLKLIKQVYFEISQNQNLVSFVLDFRLK